MHNKIVRFMTFSSYTEKSTPLYIKLNLLPINYIYKLKLGILLHNIHSGNIIGTYNLTPLAQIHSHNTRLSKNLNYYQNYIKTNSGQSTCSHQGLRFWREIPNDLKPLSRQLFKFNLKEYLFLQLRSEVE